MTTMTESNWSTDLTMLCERLAERHKRGIESLAINLATACIDGHEKTFVASRNPGRQRFEAGQAEYRPGADQAQPACRCQADAQPCKSAGPPGHRDQVKGVIFEPSLGHHGLDHRHQRFGVATHDVLALDGQHLAALPERSRTGFERGIESQHFHVGSHRSW